jgi:predicted nucleic acid-binding protein
MSAVYLDSSAIVKLAILEPESGALRRYLRRRRPWVSSSLARTEVLRALLPGGEKAVAAGRAVLARCDLVRVNDHVLTRAGMLEPHELRSLDAIHLATAERLGRDIRELVMYDEHMAHTARQLGYRVSSPA